MLFVACFITISRVVQTEEKEEYNRIVVVVFSTRSASSFTAKLHVIDVIALCAISLFRPGFAVVVVVLTVPSFGFAFSA